MRAARLLLAFAMSLAALALVVPATSAHPLGNFTINHYSGLRIASTDVLIDHVTDFAEIPTFSERRAMDTDADGNVSDAEAAAYAQTECTTFSSDLDLEVGGARQSLALTQLGIGFPMGQGNPTMRLVCVYDAPLAAALGIGTSISFTDRTFAERQGWREITLAGDGTTLSGTDLTAESASNRLTHYPADLLTVPLGQASTSFVANPGGPQLPAFVVPDATPIASTGVQPVVPAPAPADGSSAAVPPA